TYSHADFSLSHRILPDRPERQEDRHPLGARWLTPLRKTGRPRVPNSSARSRSVPDCNRISTEKMAIVISFSIFKGGTGKTTSAVNIAAALAEFGKRVLLVDLDQQASSTRYVGLDPDTINPSFYHVFLKQTPASVVRKSTPFGFDILPS